MTTYSYGPWIQNPDFTFLLTDSYGASGATRTYTVKQTFTEWGAGTYPSAVGGARACCWQHAVDSEPGTQDGTSFCATGVAKGASAGSSGTAGDAASWFNDTLFLTASQYSVAVAWSTLGSSFGYNPGANRVLSRIDPNLPTPGTGQTIEFEPDPSTYRVGYYLQANKVIKVEVQPDVVLSAAPAAAFDIQLRGQQTSTTPDHTDLGTPPMYYSASIAAGATPATFTAPWIDVTAEYVESTSDLGTGTAPDIGATVMLSVTTDRILSYRTPPDPGGGNGSSRSDAALDAGGVSAWRWTVRPPRYRIVSPIAPPLRMYQRDDQLAGGPARQTSTNRSLQSRSARAGWPGSYL